MVRWGGGFELVVLDVGLACCAVEFVAATMSHPDVLAVLPPDEADRVGTRASVLVVSGTITTRQSPVLRALYETLAEPRYVLAYGACASSGGPYWDSYSVVPGADTLLPVDVYVPGCPPRPEALLAGLRVLQERMEAA